MNKNVDHASSLGLPSHLPSLLPFLNENTKMKKSDRKQVRKSFPSWKQAHVGMEASKTNRTRWEWHHNTFTPSLHLVPFCQLCTPQNSLHALSLPIMHWMKKVLSYAHHGPTHKRRPISAMFSSNKILQHNLNSNITHRPSIAHTLHSFCIQSRQTISAMLSTATTLQQPTT